MKTRDLQRRLNKFTKERLKGITPLRVDGKMGAATRNRIQLVKYYLGFQKQNRTGKNAHAVDKEFLRRLERPNQRDHFNSAEALKRGQQRRRYQKAHAKKEAERRKVTGVGTYDGKAVANVAIAIMDWCRKTGGGGERWQGQLVSGWRSKAYSQHLCYAMCGRPSCPGRCAGVNTNHVGTTPAQFAIDVSDYARFGRVVRHCPLKPRIYNALGARDPVHFSPSGR